MKETDALLTRINLKTELDMKDLSLNWRRNTEEKIRKIIETVIRQKSSLEGNKLFSDIETIRRNYSETSKTQEILWHVVKIQLFLASTQ